MADSWPLATLPPLISRSAASASGALMPWMVPLLLADGMVHTPGAGAHDAWTTGLHCERAAVKGDAGAICKKVVALKQQACLLPCLPFPSPPSTLHPSIHTPHTPSFLTLLSIAACMHA
eukprot:scaffold4284_cov113-Isochrysis_galbana.AAC.7